jgi:hypothetical protein
MILKNNNKLFILFAILIIVLIGIGITIVKTLVPKNNQNSNISPPISNNIELHTSEGESVPVYEMPGDDYENTDFREDK